jgi:hypothetical protein
VKWLNVKALSSNPDNTQRKYGRRKAKTMLGWGCGSVVETCLAWPGPGFYSIPIQTLIVIEHHQLDCSKEVRFSFIKNSESHLEDEFGKKLIRDTESH